MDRPIRLVDLQPGVPVPELGVKVLQAPEPADLAAQIQGAIDAAAAGVAEYPMVHGLELAGAGGGATWRAIVTLTETAGWGINTSIPCAVARVMCATAANAAELETVLGKLYTAIAAAASNEPVVWQPRIVGSGRDGTYLVSLLWADGSPGRPLSSIQSTPPQGPYTAATTLMSLTIPQALNGIADTRQFWQVQWGAALNDVAGTGAKLRLELNTVSQVEFDILGSAPQWQPNASVFMYTQSEAGPAVLDLIAEPTVGGNAINVKGVYLIARQVSYNLAET